MKLGPAYDKSTDMGPLVNQGHKEFVLNWIETGIKEGAELVLDGRNPKIPAGCEKGFYLGPTIFDNVTEDMSVGREEIFGPVLCIKRVDGFEEGLKIMNASRFANGSVIYTQNGYYARTFAKETHGGMVGINVGIPVPLGIFGFTGQKQSFFGDLHMMGRDGFIFYTESKNVTQTYFAEDKEHDGKSGHLGRDDGRAVQIAACQFKGVSSSARSCRRRSDPRWSPGFSDVRLVAQYVVHFRQTCLTFRSEDASLGQNIGRKLRNLLRRLQSPSSHNQRVRHFAQNSQERLDDRAGISSRRGNGQFLEPAIRSRT